MVNQAAPRQALGPVPEPTATSTPTHPHVLVPRATQFAALTESWSQPVSCATQDPSIYVGTCDNTGCSTTLPPSQWSSALEYAYVNSVYYYTTGSAKTSTDCMPPSYEPLQSFWFSPAVRCPGGFMTATTSSVFGTTSAVGCCPPAYPTITWNYLNMIWDCYTVRDISAGDYFYVVAAGTSTDSTLTDSWLTISTVTSTTFDTATTATIYHPGVGLLLDSSSSDDGGTNIHSPGFSLFGLNRGASIGVAIAIAVCAITVFLFIVAFARKQLIKPKDKEPAPHAGAYTYAKPLQIPEQQLYSSSPPQQQHPSHQQQYQQQQYPPQQHPQQQWVPQPQPQQGYFPLQNGYGQPQYS